MLKLNLGCGDKILDGFVNCDLYNPKAQRRCDVRFLPFADDSVDEINADHIIEHFDAHEAWDVLREWKRVLRSGGVLRVETPDFLALCKAFVDAPDEQSRVNLYGAFFAKAWMPGEVHKFLYSETQLGWTMQEVGFVELHRIPATSYVGPLYLKIEGRKP